MNAENKLLQEQESAIPKRKKRNIVWIFDIVGTIVALAAVIISLVTLYEMKIQRNNAYMPTIVFESVDVNTFNTDGEYDNIFFSTRNIGVGVAKKITYSMDSSNYIRWLEYYNKLNPENPYTYNIKGEVFQVIIDGQKLGFSATEKSEKLFLLPNAEESYEFMLPSQYTFLLHEIYKHSKVGEIDIPDLEIEVTYSDVQNVQYMETIQLSVKTFGLINTEEASCVSYQIYMK